VKGDAPSWLDLAIENWARWHKKRMLRLQCRSVEHTYRSPQRRHWPSDAPPFEIRMVSVLAAQEVEDAWVTLPFVPKMVLKMWFVMRRRSGVICRSLRRKGWPVMDRDFGLEVERAKAMLAQRLDALKGEEHNPRDAVVCVQDAHVGGQPTHQKAAG